MQALGLEETVDKKVSILPTKTSISIPIPIIIPKNISFDHDLHEQYSLKSNIFNPSKMSPPDYWRDRLEQRIKDHYTFKSNNE